MDTGRKYSDEQISILRETSMVSIMASLGHDTTRGSNGLYRSPFRNERVGSLHINDAKHIWCDHGGYDPHSRSGKPGGDTIAFVRALRGCSFTEALEFLASFNPNIVPIESAERERRERENRSSKVSVLSVGEFDRTSLIGYAVKERRIPEALLRRYCRQVTYSLDGRDRQLFAIGFPNRSGGWALRNAMNTGLRKFSTGGDITLIDSDGRFRTDDMTPSSGKVVLFEGFFDFLSWMAWNRAEVPTMDVVVLNSVSNLAKAYDIVEAHSLAVTMLDNDHAGREFTARLVEHCSQPGVPPVRILDSSRAIEEGKDLSDMWVSACRREEVRAFGRSMAAEDDDRSEGLHR